MADIQKDKFVTALRAYAKTIWDAQQASEVLVEEFNARGWSGNISDADISGDNYDVTAQAVSDYIGSVAAVQTLLTQGHATNFAKMIRR